MALRRAPQKVFASAASQIRIRLSTLPAAKARPSGLKARLLTHPEVVETMSMAPFARRPSTSHSRTVFSRPPLARSLPSGLNATALTSSLALRLAIDARRSASQSRVLWIATFRTQAMSRRYLRWLWVS